MKQTYITLAAILVFLTAACGRGSAKGIKIEDAWVRAATVQLMEGQNQGQNDMSSSEGMEDIGGSNSAAYMVIINNGNVSDRLLKAHSDLARSTELHVSEENDGVMSMHPVEAVEVPARGKAELKPGSYHVMLVGINQDLMAGEKIVLILQFEKAGEMQVEAEVRSP